MFDIGFSEMLVIAVVALIVIGPERLPKVARTLGHLFGRMQRYVNDVKSDIQREMELEELRKLQASVQDAAREIETSVNRQVSEANKELDALAKPYDHLAASMPHDPAPAGVFASSPSTSSAPAADAVPAAAPDPAPAPAPAAAAAPTPGPAVAPEPAATAVRPS